MKLRMALVALWLAVGAALAVLFSRRQDRSFRRQMTRQAQTWRKQSARTADRLNGQMQKGVQDLVTNTRKVARRARAS
ncbi:MAG TPA: hypothetical protein VH540_15245 [Ktedonobacterales bacterium]|jgi:hypothetical protein